MNIQLRQAVKKDVFEYGQMVKQFRQEYQTSGKLSEIAGSFKEIALNDIKRGACYLITAKDVIIGYVDLMFVFEKQTNKIARSYILNLFVKPAYRKQGVAKSARKMLLDSGKILGSVVSFRRAKQLVNYYRDLGYTYVRPFPEYDFGGRDENLCLVLSPKHETDKWTLDLTKEHVSWTQNLASHLAKLQMTGQINELSIVNR